MQRWLRRLPVVVLSAIVFSLFPDGLAVQASAIDIAPAVVELPYQAAPAAPVVAPPAQSQEPRPEPPEGFDMSIAAIDAAPGYCSSTGGSTSYEAITSANFTQNPGGTWQLEVQVFIANPQGCTAGEACPSYDPSPENVNAWIDWNGDKTWDASEMVMDVALTGYLGINYQGTMTAIGSFSQPEIITDTTWARVNLGWSTDPNDPCMGSWAWGNVVDQELNIGGPKIKEIKVEGSKDPKNPMTTYDVKLEAIMDVPPDYEITDVQWSGDLTPGAGNPSYTYKPNKATHGKKKIKATAHYRHIPTGATGKVAKEHEFKLFFEKKGDDDADGDPNWFDYWGGDGAVPGLTNAIVRFDSSKGAGQYGSWNPGTDKVDLGAAAAETHYPGGLVIDAVTYGNVKGIDSVSEVIGHELRHRTTNHNWNAGGPWVGKTDTDNGVPDANYWDLLPDEYEDTFGTDKTKTDSKDLEHKKSPIYKYYGDNEFDAIVAGHGFRGTADKDWSNPGSQSDPAFKTLMAMASQAATIESLQATSGPASPSARYAPNEVVLPGLANLSGSYSDSGVNSDGDAAIELLRITVNLDVVAPDFYSVIGWIHNGAGQEVAWAQRTLYLNAGSQIANLDFDGALLYQEGVSTSYTLARVEVRGGEHADLVAFVDNAYTTGAYAAGNFAPPAVTFDNTFSDAGEETDTDGLFNNLNIDVGVTVREPGTYTLVGWLSDQAGNQIPGGSASATFDSSGVKRLAFNGQNIRWHRADGPYVLQLLEVRNALHNPVIRSVDVYSTTVYSATSFGPQSVATLVADSYVSKGLDVNSDGLFDYLLVDLLVDATLAGNYNLLATLRSEDRQVLADVDVPLLLSGGTVTASLLFPGGLIRSLGVDGPYRVEAVSLLDESGTTLDYQTFAHATLAHSHTSFALPLVSLSGGYKDYAADTGGDPAPDAVKVEVGLQPGDNNGVVIAQGQLVDKNGAEIAWVNSSVAVTAGLPVSVTLTFSASDILTHGVDGPFILGSLLVYHTGDPAQEVAVTNAHVTAPYNHTNLQPLVVIGPPAQLLVVVTPDSLPADGASTAAVQITVLDAGGFAVANQIVNLSASRGSLSSSSGKTNINGTVTVSLSASSIAGSGVVSGSLGSLSGSDTITFLPGAPAELTLFVNPTKADADGASVISVSAVVRDQYGNVVPGQAVTFSASAGTIGATATTDSGGSATTQLVAPTAGGTASVSASIAGLVQSAQVEFDSDGVFMPYVERQ